MKKIIVAVLFTVLTIGLCSCEKKEKDSPDLIYTLNEDGKSYSVRGGEIQLRRSENIMIPAKYNGLPVTCIEDEAFEQAYILKSITIPNSVTSIGERAFSGCSSLAEVHISDIGAWCNISFGNASANPLDYADNLYLNGNLVTELVIPDTVKEINDYAFCDCDQLTSIIIPDSVTTIGERAFMNCDDLISVTIGNGVTTIGNRAFDYCTALTEIYFNATAMNDLSSDVQVFSEDLRGAGMKVIIGKNVTKIPAYLFRSSPVVSIEFEEGSVCESIGDNAFFDCVRISSIKIGSNFKFINKYTLADFGYRIYNEYDNGYYLGNDKNPYLVLIQSESTDITSFNIHRDTKAVASGAFDGCVGLTSIIIPGSVASIGENAFKDCAKINSVYYGGENTKEWLNLLSGYGNSNLPNPISYYSESAPNYEGNFWHYVDGVVTTWQENEYNYLYSKGLNFKSNGDGTCGLIAIGDCTDTNIKIPPVSSSGDIVSSIGHYAFYSCDSLTSVTIGNSISSIGDNAFSRCTNLSTVYYSGENAKEWLNLLSGYGNSDLPVPSYYRESPPNYEGNFWHYVDGVVTPWQENEYNYLYSKGLYFKSNGDGTCGLIAIGDCTDTNTKIPPISPSGDIVNSIGSSAFYECTNLTSVTIPDNVTSIGKWAFKDCNVLTSVIIPDSVTDIDFYAFENCVGLTSVTIGKGVTSIGGYAFLGCTNLKEVRIKDIANWCNISFTSNGNNPLMYAHNLYLKDKLVVDLIIPETVKEIKSYAFLGCTSLTSVTIGKGVTSIGDSAFGLCSNIKEVRINDISSWCNISFDDPYSNPLVYSKNLYLNGNLITNLVIPDTVKEVKNYAFDCCTSITSITIPSSVNSIGEDAFYGCANVKEVRISDMEKWCNISFANEFANPVVEASLYLNGNLVTDLVVPNTVKNVKSNTFAGCISITSITIPSNVTCIGEKAFYGCINVKNAIIGDGVSEIGNGAFSYCSKLENVAIGNGVASIGDSAFSDCTSLTSVTIPDCVTSIGSYAFSSCDKLKSITIPDGVTTIGDFAFSGCVGLTNIKISESVTSIGNAPFSGCINLTSIEVSENNRYYSSVYGNLYSKDGKTLIQYATGKKDTDFIIPSNVEIVGNGAFSGCSSLTSITIPYSVTYIGDSAFNGCVGLTSVNIPDSVTFIGDTAFSGCLGLTSVTIPDSVESVGNYAFYGCTGLIDVTVGDGVTSIGEQAFCGCISLESVTIGNSVTYISPYAFSGCDGIKNVYYAGTAEEWSKISIDAYNDEMSNATRYYYSEEESTEEGNFWHYDEDGNVVIW